MRKIFIAAFLIVPLVCFLGCEEETKRPAPDVSKVLANVQLIRYDAMLMEMDPDKPESSYLNLLSKYPRMTELYFKELTRLHSTERDTFYNRIAGFLRDKRITSLGDTIKYIFPYDMDMAKILALPSKYLRYYFPEYGLPEFYALFTEFGYQTFIFEDKDRRNAIGIGLDYFLGEDFDYKKIDPGNAIFSSYLTRTYTPEYIPKKVMEMIVIDLVGEPSGKRFIDKMLYQGKKAYILEHLLPETPDSILWEFTSDQMKWVEDNEQEMWSFFLEKELMYETNHLKVAHYLDPAPTSKGMPANAPGRTAAYSGYKIVKSYMKRNPDISMQELIKLRDSQRFLEESKYKPPRR